MLVEQVGPTALVAQSHSEGPGSTDREAMMGTARDVVDSLDPVRCPLACAVGTATCS